MSTTTYPVHVDAQLDPRLSRWLWLVKWLLVLPHYIVLAFLWIAFVVMSVIAFFAILFTGRYPRSIFEFNVGVLRWTWRVAYYAYGALGTDRYPPFSLHDVPDYPAHLEVEYPEHLSRGLVLVKWWLLAIPHYIVVGLLLGGAGYAISGGGSDDPAVWGAGLIGLLVLVAGVMLLFTGRYPQQLYDLVLGLNRWVLRVAGYAALMTDKYPPFSLEQGGHETGDGNGSGVVIDPRPTAAPPVATPAPGPGPVSFPSASLPPTPARPRHQSGWTAGRIVSLVVGALFASMALGSGVAGAALVAADQVARDEDGFLMSGVQPLATSTYAIASTNVDLHVDAPAAFVPDAVFGDVKLSASSTDGSDTFVAIGPTARVERYLAGVRHATLVELTDGDPVYRTTSGSAPDSLPTGMDFWVAQSSGPGTQEITWPVQDGDWSAVVMNSDASPGIAVDVRAGAEAPALAWLSGILLITAAIALMLAVVFISVPLRAVSRAATTPDPTSQATA
jgi:hypothetical protein